MKSILIAILCLLLSGLSIQAQTDSKPQTIRIYVMGAVIRNGSYDVPIKMAFIDAILQAGGPGDLADLRNIKIYRPSPPENGGVATKLVTTVDYNSIINGTGNMPELKSGDIIRIAQKVPTYAEPPAKSGGN